MIRPEYSTVEGYDGRTYIELWDGERTWTLASASDPEVAERLVQKMTEESTK